MTILFDLYNVYYRAFKGEDPMQTIYNNQKLQTQGISGSIRRIQNYINKYLAEGGQCYFIFDDSNGGKRPDDEKYKANRKKESKAFYTGINYLESILRSYRDNCYVVRELIEADNWVKPITEKLLKEVPDRKVLLISTDMDWSRSLSENVHWLSYYNGKVYQPSDYLEKYGFYPTESAVCFYKCFHGDKSDNLDGIYPQISPVKFKYIIDSFKDMKDFLRGCREKNIPLFNDAIYDRIEREKGNLLNIWNIVSYEIIPGNLENYLHETKVNMLKLNQLYKGLCISVDNRAISKAGIMDALTEVQLTKRK